MYAVSIQQVKPFSSMSAHVNLHRRFFGSLLCCVGLFVISGAAGAELIIENVTVLTPDQPRPTTQQHVRVRDERIAEISSRPLAANAGVQRIDGRGKFLTPGLMDSHVHVSEPPGFPLGSADPRLAPLMDAYAKQQPRSYLYYGVTQVLDPANTLSAIETFNSQSLHPDLVRCGLAPALDGYPSMFVPKPQRYTFMPDFIFEPANAEKHPLPPGVDAQAHTPEAVVERIANTKAICIKVAIEEGFGGASDWPILSLDTLKRVRAAAKKHGLLVLAHANSIKAQRIAVQAQVDVLAHGVWNWGELNDQPGIPPELDAHLRQVHAQRIGYQPTLRVLPGMADLFREDALKDPAYKKVVPPQLLDWYASAAGQWFKQQLRTDFGGLPDTRIAHIHLQTAERGMRAAKFMHDLGHPLLLGSDTPSAPTYGNQPGYDTYREMRFLAQSGIPLDAIFRAGTINTARQFKLEKDYGTISAGKIANLLILDANPLETVRAWTLIDKVVLRGKVIERESLAAD
jgi:imidazolonepropionase-like amidohydrolase